jgi:hypothetical protein
VLIAERQDTAEDIFERILFAYKNLPDDVKVPTEAGRKPGTTQIHFIHGGGIKVLTAGGRSPAVGRSIDRLLITEFGEAQWQRKAAANIFPAVNKRQNARVILESTPGSAGSHHETMWHNALEGKGRFHPVFLEWWLDPSCRSDPAGLKPTEVEVEYMKRHPGMDLHNLAFRRLSLQTEMGNDERLFTSKYPSDAYDGWLGSGSPVMPIDVLKESLLHSITPPEPVAKGASLLEKPVRGRAYLICADPAGFGGSGDNSAVTVWDATERREVAVGVVTAGVMATGAVTGATTAATAKGESIFTPLATSSETRLPSSTEKSVRLLLISNLAPLARASSEPSARTLETWSTVPTSRERS